MTGDENTGARLAGRSFIYKHAETPDAKKRQAEIVTIRKELRMAVKATTYGANMGLNRSPTDRKWHQSAQVVRVKLEELDSVSEAKGIVPQHKLRAGLEEHSSPQATPQK